MSRLVTAVGVLGCTGWFCDSTFAAEPNHVAISPLATLGKLAVALILVLLVFWVFARVMRQFHGVKGNLHSGLKFVGSLSLGQKERVIVIQAGDEQLVLGVTANQINTLHVLATPLSNGGNEEIGDFRQKLSAALKRQVGG